jgi:hypothetical protein
LFFRRSTSPDVARFLSGRMVPASRVGHAADIKTCNATGTMQSLVVDRSLRHALRRMDGRRFPHPAREDSRGPASYLQAIVAHSLKWLRASETLIAAYLVCRSSTCPSYHVFHPFADFPHGSRSPDRIHNTEGQPLAYVYSRGSEAEARRAKMLTKWTRRDGSPSKSRAA